MVRVVELAESLLAWLHDLFGVPLCPGDWAWTATAFGALIGVLPTVAALLAITVRRVVGNSYGPVTGAIFAVLGVVSTLVVPWMAFSATFKLLRGRGLPGTGSLDSAPCLAFTQFDYLVKAPPFVEAITGRDLEYVIAAGATAALALLCLLFVMLQAGSAFRLGPSWPRRVFWPPFVVLLVSTSALPVTLVGHLLLGFFPISLLGSLVVRVFGLTTAMLNRPGRDRGNQSPQPAVSRTPPPQQPSPQSKPQSHQPQSHQHQSQPHQQQPHQPSQGQPPPYKVEKPPPYQPAHIPPYQPIPPYRPTPPQRHYPPTRVADVPVEAPKPTRVEQPAPLADTPGPLPFGPGGTGGSGTGGATSAQKAASDSGTVWNPAGGRFRRIRQLGRGGFGTVWLAVDEQLARTVAVKLAHAPDNETEQRMVREARALAAVRHPNCVRVFDIVQDPDGLAIIMEYIDGQPLSDVVLKNGMLADTLAARLWVNMADALAAAHEQGVLHRDVKPSNVIVDTQGTAHLIDFGIARSKGDSTLTATGMMVGTPDFLAPETARGEAASPASDAWQLAATVSYALTGHPPRGSRENPISSLMAAAQGEPCVKLPQHSAHSRLLTTALDPDPAKRPTLAAIRNELSGWLSQAGLSKEGPVTRMIDRPEPPTRPVR
ncbi:putative Ser/Thr protein kinase [Saccharothrix ecbatanensis]|uniref:non-specific serine/threonine protein kinase n=1 Tax=Saccharothrix ecbatanensis TaxID=1105145 RepID=A0A7W9M4V9_9PSEU|nr:serine/threonine-protein kinase [Saccharothrix ecbatanensis]MBB5807536.1 putative Ser/Thr protein kinase [Saccharothrix ecbatanensis]